MNLSKLALAAAIFAVAAVPTLASAKPSAQRSGSTTTYYNHGKQVGKSTTQGNTTRYYVRGKPVGKSIRHGK